MQPLQLRQFLHVFEIQRRPALPQHEALRVFRDFAQRLDVAVVLRLIDGGGQLVIRLQFVRLMGKTVGMIQLHQFFPEPRQLRFLLGGQWRPFSPPPPTILRIPCPIALWPARNPAPPVPLRRYCRE